MVYLCKYDSRKYAKAKKHGKGAKTAEKQEGV
jgi:hypothetical protein